jgi:hypothetical protein
MNMNEDEHFDERFWNDHNRWPYDTSGYIFFSRAIQKLESAIYPAPLVAPEKGRPDTDEIEAAAIEDANEAYEAAQICRRYKSVKRFIGACRDGILDCATRPKAGGEYRKLGQSIWNTERCLHWFRFCDILLESPYDTEDEAVWSDTKQWLFVTSESLERFASLELVTSPSHTSPYLSPYMALMLGVIHDLGVTQTNQPAVKVLAAEFIKRWREMGNKQPLSARLSQSMATLVRDVESQAGGIKPQSKISRKK